LSEKKPRPRGQIKDLGGGKFRIAVYTGEDARGKRSYHHETLYGSTPAKARKRVEAIASRVHDGTYFEPSKMLFQDSLTTWLERKKRKGLKPYTLETYETFMETYIKPTLGGVQLRHLGVKVLQDFIDGLQDDKLKPSTIRLICVPVKQSLDLMVKYGHIKDNPYKLVECPPMNEPRKAKVFDEREVFRFIETVSEEPNDFIFLFALVTGMRPCEFIGLRYRYLELVREEIEGQVVERGLCRVLETVVRLRHGEWYFSDPKTDKGRRQIFFPAFMYHALEARRDAHLENLERLGKSHDLVFVDRKGEPYNRDWLGRGHFKRALKRASIETEGRTLYTLRRSSATLSMLLGGISTKALSNKLGHSSVKFTQDEYVDVLPITQKVVSDRLEDFLFRTNLAQQGSDRVM